MSIQNNKSRQRLTRVLIAVDNWLQARARANPKNAGKHVATEINSLLNRAYASDTGCDPHTGEPYAPKE